MHDGSALLRIKSVEEGVYREGGHLNRVGGRADKRSACGALNGRYRSAFSAGIGVFSWGLFFWPGIGLPGIGRRSTVTRDTLKYGFVLLLETATDGIRAHAEST